MGIRDKPIRSAVRQSHSAATSDEVEDLPAEARQLKETLAEVLIENRPPDLEARVA
jgi:predicted RNA-binding Zn ribbon-like protein